MSVKFSFIVPIYNVDEYLSDCLESLLIQSYSNYEIILVNDGSTDNSLSICKKYSKIYSNVILVEQDNRGLSEARNAGIRVANGEYIIFIDSDDFWSNKNALDNINSLIDKKSADLVIFGFSYYFNNGITKSSYFDMNFSFTGNIGFDFMDLIKHDIYAPSACNKCIKRDILIKNNLYFEPNKLSEDILWCALLFLFIRSYEVYNEPIYMYRQRETSISYLPVKKNIIHILTSIDDIVNLPISNKSKENLLLYASKVYLETIPYFNNLWGSSDEYLINKNSFLIEKNHFILNRKRKLIYILSKVLGLKIASIVLNKLVLLYRRVR